MEGICVCCQYGCRSNLSGVGLSAGTSYILHHSNEGSCQCYRCSLCQGKGCFGLKCQYNWWFQSEICCRAVYLTGNVYDVCVLLYFSMYLSQTRVAVKQVYLTGSKNIDAFYNNVLWFFNLLNLYTSSVCDLELNSDLKTRMQLGQQLGSRLEML